MRTTAKAKVTLTIEISVSSSWGDDCPLSQVYKQAEDAARNIVVRDIGCCATIIGTPKVDAVLVSK